MSVTSQLENVHRVRSISMRCQTCPWHFRCPIEQSDSRILCRACESKGDKSQ